MERRKLFKYGLAGTFVTFLPRIPVSLACDPTSDDIEGPFYTPNAPQRNILYPKGAEGELLFLTGTVYFKDCQTPVPGAVLDVWQADHEGAYDNEGYNYRGVFETDSVGNYAMETVLPGKYLNGAQFRPRHIHFKIRHQDMELTTQLYFEGDKEIPSDPWASDPDAEGRIIPLSTDLQENLHGVFDIYINAEAVSADEQLSASDIASRIISIYPNPLNQNGKVYVRISQPARVRLHLVDLSGNRVSTVTSQTNTPSEFSIPLSYHGANGLKLNPGVYIVQLEVNGNIIDAKRCLII